MIEMETIMAEQIVKTEYSELMQKSYIDYSMSVITARALPDARDGLKPVQRRVLYAMDQLGLNYDKPHRKSARIVGDTMGKYHPHGDSSIYETLVVLEQDFKKGMALVDGHGNFGSIEGDGAAAMRYTEAKLKKFTQDVYLADLDKDVVDFIPNFDETEKEPVVLPSRYPNLLVNGTSGIAVGMATNIPPHNLGETIDAYVAMLDNPEITVEELMGYLPGPDFPTGGIIMGNAGIRQAYRTGRGRILVRARAEIEEAGNGKSRIVVTEIPYQVNKARLVEKIAELVHDKRIEGISDLRDASDRKGLRIIIDLKRDVNANVVLNQLYKHTQMQDTFGVIMLCLVDGEPKVLNLREMLYHYMRFQEDVVTRRTQYDLDKARERLHILEGLMIALDNIDEIVELIKRSANSAEAKTALCERFGLSEKQAQAILDMRLARLTGLERDKINDEHAELTKTAAYYESILADENKLRGIIRDEILEVRRRYADPRRTEIAPASDDIDLDDIIQEEDMAVTMTHLGYVKRIAADSYKAQNRGGKGIMAQATRDEDFVEHLFVTSTHNYIMFFTNTGRAYKIKCYNIPEASRTAKGTAIVNLLQLAGGEKITAVFPVDKDTEGEYLVLATKDGVIKKTPMSDFDNIRKGGIIAQNLRDGDELISVLLSKGDDDLLIGTREGKCVRFNEGDVRSMGRTATGVRAITLEDGDEVIDVNLIAPGMTVLSITEKGMGKRTDEEEYPLRHRGGKGVIANAITEKTGKLACMKVCTGDEDIMMIRDDGTVIRTPVDKISIFSRNTQGVRLMRVDEGTKVASVALAPHDKGEETEEE